MCADVRRWGIMDKAYIEKLMELAGETDRAALGTMYNAWVRKFAAYREDDSRSNLAEWQAAEKALKAKVDELTAKHMDAVDAAPLPDRKAAWEFLRAQGFKVSSGKFYTDCAKGMVKVAADGSISESEALAYAVRYLKKVKGSDADAALDGIFKEKAQAELNLRITQEKKMAFELEREMGNYLPKADVLTQFAVKWGTLEASLRHLLRTRARDWIYACGGDAKKFDMFVALVGSEMDEIFNSMATIEDLEISLVVDGGSD